jgi:2Fe-2S ferredoxin
MAKLIVTDRDGQRHEVEGQPGVSIMESLREEDFGVEALCGGMCSCATCHCYIAASWQERIEPRGDDELELLEELECFQDGSRLTCQVVMTDDLDGLEVTIAPEE